jgi:ankyrin repeat protein
MWRSTALHYAVKRDDAIAVSSLLAKMTNIDIFDANGLTPLYLALGFECTEIIKLLLNHGADVNVSSDSGQPALLLVVKARNTRNAELLLQRGARVHQTDRYGQSPLQIACANNDVLMAIILLFYGSKPTQQTKGSKDSPFLTMTAENRTILEKANDIFEDMLSEYNRKHKDATPITIPARLPHFIEYLTKKILTKPLWESLILKINLQHSKQEIIKDLEIQGSRLPSHRESSEPPRGSPPHYVPSIHASTF